MARSRAAGMRLGRRKPDPDRPVLHLGDFLTGAAPAHPPAVDHLAFVGDWGLYGNDKYGDCGPTCTANSRKLTTRYLTNVEKSPSQADVFDLYRRSGNAGFDPATGVDDNGVVMADMLKAAQAGGLGGMKAVAYAAVDVHDPDMVRAAIDVFGFVLLGVDLQTAQQQQTDQGVWDYKRSRKWGGHAVLGGRFTSATSGPDVGVVTWAKVVGMTGEFWSRQVDEAWVVIWPEHLGSAQFDQAIDRDAANAAYTALTGKPGPFTAAPPPMPPTPAALPADVTMAAAMRAWLSARRL